MNQSKIVKPSGWDRANFLSRIFFTWVWPLFVIGNRRDLRFEDLFQCSASDRAEKLVNELERNWKQELQKAANSQKRKPSFAFTIVRTYFGQFLPIIFIFLFQECAVQLIQPILLGRLLRYFEQRGEDEQTMTRNEASWYAAGIVATTVLYVAVNYITFASTLRVGARMRAACCALMYRKAIRLSRAALAKTTVGQIVNIMSNDVNRFDEVSLYVHSVLSSVIQSTLIMIVLWGHLSWACLSGIAVLLLFMPLQAVMGRLFQVVRRRTAPLTDNRIRIMSEIIAGIRVIKMYTWEAPFVDKICAARKAEIHCIRQASLLRALNLAIYFIASKIILFACFVPYVYFGGRLRPESIFVAMAYFNTMQLTVARRFPVSIASYAETYVTCGRIETFLLLDEIDQEEKKDCDQKLPKKALNQIEYHTVDKNKDKTNNKKTAEILSFTNVSARWISEITRPTLANINFRLKPGELLIVIGPIGAGKSSLLHTILGDLRVDSGRIGRAGALSYAPQQPWIFAGTIRENILFGAPYDAERYRDVIRVCALERDIALMTPLGDRTRVGERGAALSGGQRTRITLARAVYRRAPIYLLDDPLSAVDAHVARRLFNHCIRGYLRESTRIVVTHQSRYLPAADRILILSGDGETIAYGSYRELRERGIDFSQFVNPQAENAKNKSCENEELEAISDERSDPIISNSSREKTNSFAFSIGSIESGNSDTRSRNSSCSGDDDNDDGTNLRKLSFEVKEVKEDKKQDFESSLNEETKKSGSVGFRVYFRYIAASRSPIFAAIAFASMIVSQLLFLYSDIWITEWTQTISTTNVAQNQSSNTTIETMTAAGDSNFFVAIYSALIGAMFLTAIIRTISFFIVCMRGSANLHNHIFARLLRTRVAHFDRHSAGEILNRFAKDTGIVDELLPGIGFEAQVTVTTIIGGLAVNAYTNIYLLIPAVALGAVAYLLGRFYISTARDVKRLEGIARSPIFAHVNNTLTGLTTIRSFGVAPMFERQFSSLLDDHTAIYFLNICCPRTLGIVMDLFCALYLASVVLFVMFFPAVLAGYAGLAISSSLMMRGMLQIAIRNVADVESYMTSVERMLEYTELEPEEIKQKVEKQKPNKKLITNNNENTAEKSKQISPIQLSAMITAPFDEANCDFRNGARGNGARGGAAISFENLSLYYDDVDRPVLRGITAQIPAGSKIGIVGRTGAGKSSLIAALFRLCRRWSGAIRIDGVDHRTIEPLAALRRRISIIPQEPLIFSGSVRYNIDPFDAFDDAEIWRALKEVQLSEAIAQLPGGLAAPIQAAGDNLSVGERQLICLARAILRDDEILVLDEATANVDPRTDALIQRTIRRRFARCTVLTIAHRLRTIIDCDRVMVLDAGRLVEFDSPHRLLQSSVRDNAANDNGDADNDNDGRGTFAQLIEQTGERMSRRLRQIAEQHYRARGDKQ